MFADIIVDVSVEALDRTFQYKIPEGLSREVRPGSVVKIPFGRANKIITGFVVGLSQEANWPEDKLKEIAEMESKEIAIEGKLLSLAAWMRERYGGTMSEALKTVLPVKKQIKSVEIHWLNFLVSKEEVEEEIAVCRRKNHRAKVRFLEGMISEGGQMTSKLARQKYQVSTAVIQAYVDRGFVAMDSQIDYRTPLTYEKIQAKISLNPEQEEACQTFWRDYEEGIRKTYLLYGITGSGKTEVYIEMIRRVIQMGKQAIVLIPEIALTRQTVKRFIKNLGDRVTILNSRMSEGERFDQYQRVKEGLVDIVIGPRSALFVPFSNLGLIIIDEEHETSYKSETTPCYHARETAIQLAKLCHASLVLGSATPSMESYVAACQGNYQMLKLTHKAKNTFDARVSVVDLRQELAEGNRSVISRLLQEKIRDRLKKKEQVMLFLNRRGYAGFVSCRSCGYVLKCSHCDVSMTAHKNHVGEVDHLVCHYCGHSTYMPKTCPECGSPYVAAFGLGTQKVEEMLHRLVPEAKILRMDSDTTSGKNGHEQVLAPFRQGKIDILIGTQMIVKGHDFPNVTLVAALAADLSMHAGDYRSQERTYDLLMQACGRAGRGDKPGEMIIQTYNPDRYCIRAVEEQDPQIFYENEAAYRRVMNYPPYVRMMALLVTSESKARASACIYGLAEVLASETCQKIGPAEAGLSRAKDRYRYSMYLKANSWEELEKIKDTMEEWYRASGFFADCQLIFNMDPMNSY
ncbi:MAG: primosomal protein N' [Eubacterium sp.]|nr:primosomal protein N' [Eubacterium sp.]